MVVTSAKRSTHAVWQNPYLQNKTLLQKRIAKISVQMPQSCREGNCASERCTQFDGIKVNLATLRFQMYLFSRHIEKQSFGCWNSSKPLLGTNISIQVLSLRIATISQCFSPLPWGKPGLRQSSLRVSLSHLVLVPAGRWGLVSLMLPLCPQATSPQESCFQGNLNFSAVSHYLQ